MRRRLSPLLAGALLLADLIALWGAFAATAASRIALNQWFHHEFTRDLVSALFPPLPLVAACWISSLAWFGAYDLLGRRSSAEVFRHTLGAVSLAMGLQIVVLFFLTRETYSRSLMVGFWAVSLLFLSAGREVAFLGLRALKRRGLVGEPVAVVGTGPLARMLAAKLEADREPRFRLAGFVSDARTTEEERRELGARIVGHADKIETAINEQGLVRLFLADPSLRSAEAAELAAVADRMGVGVDRVPDLQGLVAGRVSVTELDGVPLLAFEPHRLTRVDVAVKRTLDLVLAAAGLLVLAPLLAVIAAAVKLTSPGPVLFAQRRVGRGGKHFKLLKFRSMLAGAERQKAELEGRNEAEGFLFKLREDPRVTPIGRFLRRWSLDELPQLWNVLAGEMSLVGPRPLPKDDLEGGDPSWSYWLERRRTVRPGITGLWQVSGRSGLPFEEMVGLDLWYINNWSLGLDLRLLLRTVPVVLRGQGAW